jgi:hypothetical protein
MFGVTLDQLSPINQKDDKLNIKKLCQDLCSTTKDLNLITR